MYLETGRISILLIDVWDVSTHFPSGLKLHAFTFALKLM
jgi:hypothetical protein